jgi:hypothetical protein
MFVENIESLPEEMRGEFVESERDGKKGFQHKDTVALVNSMKNAKAERDELRGKFEGVNSKLSEFEKGQQEAIEKAKAAALDEARSNKDVDAIELRYQQQMADLEVRVRQEARDEVTNEFKSQSANEKAVSIAEKIGLELGIDTDAADVITQLIMARVKVDPSTGKEIYHDTKGSALSVDRKAFIDEIKKESRFSRLTKADVNTSGGLDVNGSGNSGSAGVVPRTFEECKGNRALETAFYNKQMGL